VSLTLPPMLVAAPLIRSSSMVLLLTLRQRPELAYRM